MVKSNLIYKMILLQKQSFIRQNLLNLKYVKHNEIVKGWWKSFQQFKSYEQNVSIPGEQT